MKLTTKFILAASLLHLSGCETYRTYYGETAQEVKVEATQYRLDLSYSSLEKLPPNLSLKEELRTLNLSGNPKLDIQSAVAELCKLPNLHILLLNDMQLKAIPEAIADCPALTQISLSKNPELNFNQTFQTLSTLNLEFLDISDNQLNELPQELSLLKTLKDLRLSGNHISSPQAYITLAKLPQLFSLWLNNNALTDLPNEIGLLPRVGYLYLDNNSLTELPNGIVYMRRLSSLWLGHNCFQQIPAVLANTGVYMVFLNNNRITRIGERFEKGSFFIQGIALDNNYLTEHQTKAAKKIFYDTFIYSDANQLPQNSLASCTPNRTSETAS